MNQDELREGSISGGSGGACSPNSISSIISQLEGISKMAKEMEENPNFKVAMELKIKEMDLKVQEEITNQKKADIMLEQTKLNRKKELQKEYFAMQALLQRDKLTIKAKMQQDKLTFKANLKLEEQTLMLDMQKQQNNDVQQQQKKKSLIPSSGTLWGVLSLGFGIATYNGILNEDYISLANGQRLGGSMIAISLIGFSFKFVNFVRDKI